VRVCVCVSCVCRLKDGGCTITSCATFLGACVCVCVSCVCVGLKMEAVRLRRAPLSWVLCVCVCDVCVWRFKDG